MTAEQTLDEKSGPTVFISYSRKDLDFANRLETALKGRGFKTLIDRAEIYALEELWKRIEQLIIEADTVVFILSPDSLASDWTQREVAFAVSLNKRLAPVVWRHVDNKSVPEDLAKLNFIFLNNEDTFDLNFDLLVEALLTDISWIRDHTEFGEQARRWDLKKRPTGLLLRSPTLEQAEYWVASRPTGAPLPTELIKEFIAESRRDATRRRNVLTGGLALGFVVAATLAALAYWQRTIAEDQRDKSYVTQSHYLARASAGSLTGFDLNRAISLAIEGLPKNARNPDRPYVPEVEQALRVAFRVLTGVSFEVTATHKFKTTAEVAVLSPGGNLVAVASARSVQLYDVASDKESALPDQSDEVFALRFSDDGSLLIMVSKKELRIWDISEQKTVVDVFAEPGTQICGWAYDPTAPAAEQVKLGTADAGTALSPLRFAQTQAEIGQPRTAHYEIDFYPCSLISQLPQQFATGSMMWGEMQMVKGGVPTGRIATVTPQGKLGAMDFQTGFHMAPGQEKFVRGALAPDGTQLAAATIDGKVVIWSVANMTRLAEFSTAGNSITNMNFDASGQMLLTSSDNVVQIWSRATLAYLRSLQEGEFSSLKNPEASSVCDASPEAEKSARCVRTSPNGRHLAIVNDKEIHVLDLKTKGTVFSVTPPEGLKFLSATFNSDGKRLVVHRSDGWLTLLDSSTGILLDEMLTGGLMTDEVVPVFFSRGDDAVLIDMKQYQVAWTVFPSYQELYEAAKAKVTTCIPFNELSFFALSQEPPDWCIELRKPPYDTPDWSLWATYGRGHADAPFPGSPQWEAWSQAKQHLGNTPSVWPAWVRELANIATAKLNGIGSIGR